jgi:PAS domain-containing protein
MALLSPRERQVLEAIAFGRPNLHASPLHDLAFEASAVGIALTDENRHFVAANGAFQQMVGYIAEELAELEETDLLNSINAAVQQ